MCCFCGTICLFAQNENSFARNKRIIEGYVLDSHTKEPLVGANVVDVQNKLSTMSDAEGHFSFEILNNSKEIEVSFVSYQSQKVEVDDRNHLTVFLVESNSLLDEVVVTGVQTIERGRATGSYKIIGQDDMRNIYSLSVSEKLEGAVPGLSVDKNGEMVIRGMGSINASTKPLIVVDGFPLESTEWNINPNDIEQITILKDAASASIWGIRAANGVVVITTKRGRKGRPMVSYSGTLTSSGKVDWNDLHLLSSDQYVNVQFDKIMAQGVGYSAYEGLNELEKIYDQYNQGNISLDNARIQVNELGKFNNAKQITDNFYRHAFSQQHNLTLSAGGEYYSTYVSLNYDQTKTQLVGDEYNKFNILANNDFRLHRTLSVSLGLRGTYIKESYNGSDMTNYEPWKRILNDDGSYYNEFNGISELWASECKALGMRDWHMNSLEMMRMNDNKSKSYNLSATLKIQWKPIKGLEITSQGSYEFGSTENTQFYSQEHYMTRDLTNRFTEVDVMDGHPVSILGYHLPTSGGLKYSANNHLYSYSIRNMISYANNYKDFDYKLMAGNEVYSLEGNNLSSWLFGFDPDLLTSQSVDLASLQSGVVGYNGRNQNLGGTYAPAYSETVEHYVSYFGTACVSYLGKYDLFGSMRLDQTNMLVNSSDFRNNPSWSIGAKWDIKKEKFIKADFIDILSLRTSYGLTGNIDKTTGPDIVTEARTDEMIPSLNYLVVTNPANPELGWEKTYTWNIGIDYSLLHKRLFGSFDFYHKNSMGLLSNVDVDPTTGWSKVYKNSGTVRNMGIDLSLTARILTKTPVKWDATLNISYNSNKVTEMDYEPSRRGACKGNPLKGQPIGYIAVHRYGGLDENGEPTFMKKGDDTKYSYDQMSLLTVDDLEFVGTINPPVFGSFSSDVKYKDFTLSFMITYRFGGKMRLPNPSPTQNGLYNEWFGEKYRWIEGADNTNKWVPKLYTESSWIPSNREDCLLFSDKMIDDSDVIYFKSIRLSYDASRLLRHIGLRGGSISIGGENLGFWAANKYNLDPDQLYAGTYAWESRCGLGKTPRLVVGMNIDF